MDKNKEVIKEAFERLELGDRLQDLLKSHSFNEAIGKLQVIQKEAAANRRRIAKRIHPDIGGEEEKMKALNNALDIIMNLRINPPQLQRMFVCYYPSVPYDSTTSIYSSWTDYYYSF